MSTADRDIKPKKKVALETRKDEAVALVIAYRSSAMRDFLMRSRNAGYLPEASTDDLTNATDTEKFIAVMTGRADGATAAEVEKSLLLRDFMISSSGLPDMGVVTHTAAEVEAIFNQAADAAPATEKENDLRPTSRAPVTTTTSR